MAFFLGLVFLMTVAAAQTCSPDGFDTVSPFNTTRYLGQWYSIEQQEVAYLPVTWNYCTNTRYEQLDEDVVAVFNEASVGSVDGPQEGGEIRAIIPDLSDPSKLLVGPIEIPPALYGPYWVVAVGGAADDEPYQWAVISGGPPTIPSNGACRTRSSTVNKSGLWLFHRNPLPSTDDVQVLRETAKSLGFDLSVLNPVEHRGCNHTIFDY